MREGEAWTVADPTLCDLCGRDSCEDHLPMDETIAQGLDPRFLTDAVDVIREGRQIAAQGIRYTVDGIIPAYGMLGLLTASRISEKRIAKWREGFIRIKN